MVFKNSDKLIKNKHTKEHYSGNANLFEIFEWSVFT